MIERFEGERSPFVSCCGSLWVYYFVNNFFTGGISVVSLLSGTVLLRYSVGVVIFVMVWLVDSMEVNLERGNIGSREVLGSLWFWGLLF